MSEKKELQKPAATTVQKAHPAGLTNLATKSAAEQMQQLQEMLGGDAADVEVVIGGTLPFWPAVAGAVLVGTIQKREVRQTKYVSEKNPTGEVGLYIFRVEERAALAGTADGEIFEAAPGDFINVLEREVMKEFQTRIGQKVVILNLGKKPSKNGTHYWDYKVLGQKRTAEQIQAANAMARTMLPKASTNGTA